MNCLWSLSGCFWKKTISLEQWNYIVNTVRSPFKQPEENVGCGFSFKLAVKNY